MSIRRILAWIFVACLLSSTVAYTEDAEVKVKGLIVGRTADELTLRTANGDRIVVLSDETKAQVPSGLFRHKETSMAELIPGLAIEVKGTTDGDKLIARTIKYSKDDLRTANVIQAGLAPTQQHVAANTEAISTNKGNIAANREQIGANKQQIETNQEEVEQRFADLADYEMRGSTVVYFAPGKTILSKESKAALLELANKASGLQGYLLEVKGFADSSGDPAQNQVLSRKRAEAVIDFLHQQAKIPVRHVLAPGAMGVTEPAASNEDTSGRSANRRVEVKVLVNRGLAASAK